MQEQEDMRVSIDADNQPFLQNLAQEWGCGNNTRSLSRTINRLLFQLRTNSPIDTNPRPTQTPSEVDELAGLLND